MTTRQGLFIGILKMEQAEQVQGLCPHTLAKTVDIADMKIQSSFICLKCEMELRKEDFFEPYRNMMK